MCPLKSLEDSRSLCQFFGETASVMGQEPKNLNETAT